MKQVKPNMTNKIVYIQTFNLLEDSNWNLFEFQSIQLESAKFNR